MLFQSANVFVRFPFNNNRYIFSHIKFHTTDFAILVRCTYIICTNIQQNLFRFYLCLTQYFPCRKCIWTMHQFYIMAECQVSSWIQNINRSFICFDYKRCLNTKEKKCNRNNYILSLVEICFIFFVVD